MGEGVVLVAVFDGAEGNTGTERGALIGRNRPGAGAAAEHAKETPQQPFDLIGLMQHAIRGTGITLIDQCGWSVGILDMDHLVHYEIKRFIPTDALEFAFATLPYPQHRVKQTFGRVESLTIRTST